MRSCLARFAAILLGTCAWASALQAAATVGPDIVVAADGTGDFKTIQQAVSSIPANNTQRKIILVKDGVYTERVRVAASFVTLRGESRGGTRIEFATSDTGKGPGGAVMSVGGNDFVLQNLTVKNTFGVVGPHEVCVQGQGDRTVITDCDILSEGADTLSLWKGDSGRYYHARCNFRGSVDSVCPRGWCYAVDCSFYETLNTALVWHDGSKNQDQKFVMTNCRFDGVAGFNIARHHHDGAFYFLNAQFGKNMIDKPPFRVLYPLDGSKPTVADIQNNKQHDPTNIRGERSYYYHSHRDGGDYKWMADNLETAAGSPRPEQITATWTFGGTWNPEDQSGPRIQSISVSGDKAVVKFSESVTVRGAPKLITADGAAVYVGGSGNDTLAFSPAVARPDEITSLDLNGGAIFATLASADTRMADLKPPKKP